VKKVLKHLCKAGLYAKTEKYEFYSELVEYLGYILSSFDLTMSDNKVKIIQDWLKSKKVKDIQFFLDFANFYHYFIFNYLNIVILLTHLTWKDIPWKFNFSYHNAFNSLKKAFISILILPHWISNTYYRNWYLWLCSYCNSFYNKWKEWSLSSCFSLSPFHCGRVEL